MTRPNHALQVLADGHSASARAQPSRCFRTETGCDPRVPPGCARPEGLAEPGSLGHSHFMKQFILIASLILAVCESPATEPNESPILQQAYEQLLSVNFFAFGDVGEAWTSPLVCATSKGERAFDTLIASTNGLPLFQSAVTNGTTAARLYALIGIRHWAPEQFDTFAQSMDTNWGVVLKIGTLGMVVSTSNIVAQIKRGAFEDYCPPKSSR